jgi:hypothetical protein
MHNYVIALRVFDTHGGQSIVRVKSPFMVVRIRFGPGPLVTRRKGKNSRIALLAASLLTLASICLGSLGVWRLCQDLDLAGNFVFAQGFLSHWQVWIGAATLVQYCAWRLTRYARTGLNIATEASVSEEQSASPRLFTNV